MSSNVNLSNIRNLIKVENLLKSDNDIILRVVAKTSGSTLLKQNSIGFIIKGDTTSYHGLGCLELQIQDVYKEVFNTKKSKKISFNFNEKGDVVFGSGTYCPGKIEFLITYIDNHLKSIILEGIYNIKRGQIFTLTVNDIKLTIPPQPIIAVYGINTDDIKHFKTLAEEIGFKTILFDHRSKNIEYIRNTYGIEIIKAFPNEVNKYSNIDENTFFVIAGHNFDIDIQLLKTLLPTPVKYIGMVSSKTRFTKIIEYLQKETISIITENTLTKIYSPCGIPLNAGSYLEILLSILTQIVAIYNGATGQNR